MSNTNPACNNWPATAPFFGGPFPTRTWFRAGGAPCSGTAATRALAKKTEVLQYKGNSAQLTQKQKWAQFAKGKSHNKKQAWASQTQTVTNPNVNSDEALDKFTPYTFLQFIETVSESYIRHCN